MAVVPPLLAGTCRMLPGRIVLACLFAASLASAASPVVVPPGLPKYDLKLTIDTDLHQVDLKMRTTWINPSDRATKQLVFTFYPHYSVPRKDQFLLKKTLELFRLNPSVAMDIKGEHGNVNEVLLIGPNGSTTQLPWAFRSDNSSALVVDLPQDIGSGQSVTVELNCTIRLPNKQGRWGHWNGVHFLTNSLPTLGYYDAGGWHAMPFVPWHQPFWNEAGEYTATIRMPKAQKLGCPAAFRTDRVDGAYREVVTEPFVGRDFSMVWSADFEEYTSAVTLPSGRSITLKCLAFARHEFFAKEMLRIAGDALPVYSKWFGDYPYDQFSIVESFFGWNGNECAGLIMIDERVFDMPKLGVGYVEYLVSHETCHQWWYNLVGTNGYNETFMDEGLATYFAHRLLDQRRGKNNEFLAWPENLESYLPNIRRENYRYSAMQGAIRRGDVQPAAAPLPEFGSIYGLFTGAYDRGSKVFGMIESRLGEAAFFDFIQLIVKKYSFRSLSAVALKKELEAYTGKNWDDLFDKWVYSKGLTDWGIERVTINGERARRFGPLLPGVRQKESQKHTVEVILSQKRDFDEPTTLGFRLPGQEGYSIRVPVGPTTQAIQLPDHDLTVEPLGGGRCRVRVTLPERPVAIAVDPDGVLIDANVADNIWPVQTRVSITPLYTTATESSLTSDYDKLNLNAGLWFYGPAYQDPWYTRSSMAGLRAGAYRPDVFQAGIYSAYRADYRDVVVGVDGLFDHLPFPKTQIGFNVERRIVDPIYNTTSTHGDGGAMRASIYSRYVMIPSSSMYLYPMHYIEAYSTYSDNFLPTARNADPNGVRPTHTWLNGLHHRLNLYTPYWDPESGAWIDLTYGIGTTHLDGQDVLANQVRAEVAGVRRLPDSLGAISSIKWAARGVIQSAWPNRGEYFSLGGSTLFRGFDLAERQGSLMWVVNTEARVPIFKNVNWNVLDNMMGARNVTVAGFYDVGGIYNNGQIVNNVAHAVGVGLRVDLAVFSFIERATMRFDIAKTVNADTPVQFWYGIQHPF